MITLVKITLSGTHTEVVDLREIQYTSLQEGFKGIERTIVVLGALQGVLRNPLLSKGEEIQ